MVKILTFFDKSAIKIEDCSFEDSLKQSLQHRARTLYLWELVALVNISYDILTYLTNDIPEKLLLYGNTQGLHLLRLFCSLICLQSLELS